MTSTIRRLTPAEVAGEFRRHPVTVRNALAAGELHGSQRVKGGRWTVEEACAEAWVSGCPCEHAEVATRNNPHRRLAIVGNS